MTIEHSKEAIISLLNSTPTQGLDQEVRAALLANVNQADTASDLANCVVPCLFPLYTAYGRVLTQQLSETLSPALWQAHGVLFNAGCIPADGPDSYIVLADSSFVLQEVPKTVTYLGAVTATIAAGTAHILDSPDVVNARGQAKVYAYGGSLVNAHDESEVFYLDQSKGMAYDRSCAHAKDRSYVGVGEGHVTLYAHDMAQFAVFNGGATLFVDDSARGVVATTEEHQECVQVHLSGESLLFTQMGGDRPVVVQTADFSGTIIRGDKLPIAKERVLEVIVPRHQGTSHVEVRLQAPMDIDQLKNELKVFMNKNIPSEVIARINAASDESSLCACMVPFLPQLITNGLTGGFLRTHFSELTLEENLIHAFSRPEAERGNQKVRGTHYFFGDQLVHRDRYGGDIVCHEKTLLVTERFKSSIKVDGQASVLSTGTGMFEIHGDGQAIALDYSNITADGQAHVYAFGDCFVKADGQVWVEAHNECCVIADDYCRVITDDSCAVELGGYTRALVQDSNFVVANGHAIVGYLDTHHDDREVVKALSPSVEVHKLQSPKALEQFQALLHEHRTEKRQGVKRC